MRTTGDKNLYDRMIVEYLILTGLRKSVAYTDKTFLVKTDNNEYRHATKDETREIIKVISDEHFKILSI